MPLEIGERLVGRGFEPQRWAWTEADTILYALGVGARVETDLDLLYEGRGPLVLPTFAVIPATKSMGPTLGTLDLDLANVLHGEQSVEVHAPIPARGEVTTGGRVAGVWDKGSAAVIDFEFVSTASPATSTRSTSTRTSRAARRAPSRTEDRLTVGSTKNALEPSTSRAGERTGVAGADLSAVLKTTVYQ